jgi:hypothetical protein
MICGASAVREDRADPRALRQFTWLAVASEQLEPGTSRPVTSATYARVTAPPKPPAKRRRSRLRRLKKTRLWKAPRRKFRQLRHKGTRNAANRIAVFPRVAPRQRNDCDCARGNWGAEQ